MKKRIVNKENKQNILNIISLKQKNYSNIKTHIL